MRDRHVRSALAGPMLAALVLVPTVLGSSARAAAPDVAGMTRDMARVIPYEFRGDVRELPKQPLRPPSPMADRELSEPQGSTGEGIAPAGSFALSMPAAPIIPSAPMPSPAQNFAGLSHGDTCTGGPCGGGWPPDTNGDVGPNHYIQAVNTAYAIYSKTGTLLASFTENQLWSGAGVSLCNGSAQGDPVVLHDQLADRWMLTHLAFGVSGGRPVSPFYECIAVSKTSDPVAGGWWLYVLQMDPGGTGKPPLGTLNDYPKFAIWPDCLYMAANGFAMPVGNFVGALFASFSRSQLESGAALTWSLGLINNTSDPFTMIPGNLLGSSPTALPPPGTPNYFVSHANGAYGFEVRKFTAGANCGGGGTLSTATNVSELTGWGDPVSVPQPNTSNMLDSLGYRLMQKVQYRKVGSAESLWVVHTAGVGAQNSPLWAQLDVTGGTIATAPVQQQIYAPDTTLSRWMVSIAADSAGNVALGYNTANGTSANFPSLAYAGRLATDPLGQLPQGETQLIAGAGSQSNNCGGGPCARWGDYSAMSVDPSDDCTFWYTNEYYSSPANGSSGNWQTRIGSFKFPACTPGLPTSTPTHTPTQTASNTPTNTPTQTSTATNTPIPPPTSTPTQSPTPTQTPTPSRTPTNTPTNTPTSTPTNSPTSTPTLTATLTPTHTPTAPPTPSATVSPTPANAAVLGSVTLQGRPTPPNALWSVPLQACLTPQGGGPIACCTPTTDVNGSFACSPFPPGPYRACVKNSQTLQNCLSVTLAPGSNTVSFGTLREGDANDDNCVTLVDFSILESTFGQCAGTPTYDARADFDGNDCVSLVDFSLMATDFGICGDTN